MPKSKVLFKWGKADFYSDWKTIRHSSIYDFKSSKCPWCSHKLNITGETRDGFSHGSHINNGNCWFCGWEYKYSNEFSRTASGFWSFHGSYLILKDFNTKNPKIGFNISDPKNPINFIGTYLKKHYSDIYNLSYNKFEELIEDIFKNIGFSTVLSQVTKGNSGNVVLLKNNNVYAIVGVQKFSKNKSVQISFIDKLVGTCIQWKAKKAYLITNARLSTNTADTLSFFNSKNNFEIELWDATKILKELKCYNDAFPPLNLIDHKKTYNIR